MEKGVKVVRSADEVVLKLSGPAILNLGRSIRTVVDGVLFMSALPAHDPGNARAQGIYRILQIKRFVSYVDISEDLYVGFYRLSFLIKT